MTFGQVTGYSVAGTSIAAGILVATGILFGDLPLPSMRIILGIVMVLMGIHRYAVTRMKSIQQSRNRA